MDKIQAQILELNQKVDRLSKIVEQLSYYLISSTQENSLTALLETNQIKKNNQSENISPGASINSQELMGVHKDILNDESDNHSYSPNYHRIKEIAAGMETESGISCEVQVKRLTAQLTAAYHRIAALEEQLLAHRTQDASKNGFYRRQ